MATSPSATPTPVTPPRVPLIDERTGLIDRSWYLFFLSLFRTAQTSEDYLLATNPESLIANYDAALRALAQATETQPASGVSELAQEVCDLRQEMQTQPPSGVSELAQEVRDLRQEVQTLPQPQLGTFAALQQANLPWTTFDTTPESVPTDIGTVAWDGGTTLGIQMTANVIQRVGESEFVYVKASATITKGQLCYHTGSVGSSGVITAAPTPLALADPNQIVGVAAESIALNDFGLIQISGNLRGFNTTGSSVGETWADGDPLYYNPAYVGSMTKVKPVAPNQKSYIGEVINASSGGSGSIEIRIVPGTVLGGTDSNVEISSVLNKDLLVYNTYNLRWENENVTATFDLPTLSANGVLYLNGSKTAISGTALTFNGTTLTAPAFSGPLNGSVGASTPNTGAFTTLSASSTVTFSNGAANGILYLNGSKVATSGSALTFDGTKLNVSAGVAPFFAQNTAGSYVIDIKGVSGISNVRLGDAGDAFVVNVSGAEQIRLTSTGLGIGKTATTKLDVAGSVTAQQQTGRYFGFGVGTFSFDSTTATDYGITYTETGATFNTVLSAFTNIKFTTNRLENMRLDPFGNLGLGTTSFGTSAAKVLSVGSGTEPSSGPADTVQFYSVDRSAGNTIPAFYCEGSGVTNAGITNTAVTHKIAMKVNGTIYYLLATTNAT